MNEYEKQYSKYVEIASRGYDDYQLIIDAVRLAMVERQGTPTANAIILLGFSGNGKSTWIRNFLRLNPDYEVISMDTIQGEFFMQKIYEPGPVIRKMGEAIEEAARHGKNIIFDGNFLNLLTRSALADTLKSFGYNVNAVNITDNIEETLPKRMMDEASRLMNVKIDYSNVKRYLNNPTFLKISDKIYKYYLLERQKSAFDEQIEYGVLDLGIDKLFDRTASFNEVKTIPNPVK